MNTTLLTIMDTDAYGVSLQEARRLTDAEKPEYAEWYRQYGLICTSKIIDLPLITWADMPKRPCDGSFMGCGNRAWIITQSEWDAYIALNAERLIARQKKDEAEMREAMLEIIARADRQGGALTVEEAERRRTAWINAVNEGGEGYVPSYVTIPAVEKAEKWLAEHPEIS